MNQNRLRWKKHVNYKGETKLFFNLNILQTAAAVIAFPLAVVFYFSTLNRYNFGIVAIVTMLPVALIFVPTLKIRNQMTGYLILLYKLRNLKYTFKPMQWESQQLHDQKEKQFFYDRYMNQPSGQTGWIRQKMYQYRQKELRKARDHYAKHIEKHERQHFADAPENT